MTEIEKQSFEEYEEGLKNIKNPDTYDKGIELLEKSDKNGCFYATYILGKECGKHYSKYFDSNKSKAYFNKAFECLENVKNDDENYLLAQHYLASYYLNGYGDIFVDESRYVQIEDECAIKKYIPSCEALIEFYLKPDNLNVKRVNYYKSLLNERKKVEPVEATENAVSPKKDLQETLNEFHSTNAWKDEVFSTINLSDYERIGNFDKNENEIVKSALAEAYSIFESNEHNKYPRAFDLIKIAEKEYPVEVNCFLGEFYEDGKNIQKDLETAIYYYSKAIKFDSVYANYRLGMIYLYELVEKKNIELGLKYIRKSAQYGYAPALKELGDIYNYGKLGVINKNAANYYYSLADERGF